MNWLEQLKMDPTQWLLEVDHANPGVRYLTLRDILELTSDDTQVKSARDAVMDSGSIPLILDAQAPEGYWSKPGPGYNPKYRSTVWQMSLLAQLGADGSDQRIIAGCNYILDNTRSKHGGFSATATPSGMIHCLEGNLCAALIDLGFLGDDRLNEALDWLARSITGEGIAPNEEQDAPVRYLRSANSAPGFVCSANNQLPCAWGAVKAMLALSKVPEGYRTDAIQRAIETGITFLLSRKPAAADYPMGYSTKPNLSWFKFGFPVFYVTDVLQNLEVLTALGLGGDERLTPALELLLSKQDAQGRWKMEYTYNGKMWVDIEEKGKPSKWVTLRAMRVLKHASTT
jgi:hypothetical protein